MGWANELGAEGGPLGQNRSFNSGNSRGKQLVIQHTRYSPQASGITPTVGEVA